MAVVSISVRKYDEALIEQIQKLAERNGLVFSHLVM